MRTRNIKKMNVDPIQLIKIQAAKFVDLSGSNVQEKKEEILRSYHAVWDLEEQVYQTLSEDKSFYVYPIDIRHPLIFYYGHSAVFFINKLVMVGALKESQRIDAELEKVLEVGVDEETELVVHRDVDQCMKYFPSLDRVIQYRYKVRQLVDEIIRSAELSLPITWNDDFWWAIVMSIEHMKVHVETTSVLIRQLPIQWVRITPFWNRMANSNTDLFGSLPENDMLPVIDQTKEITIGRRRNDTQYGWDLEYGERNERVEPFSASKFLVSNGEFLDFVLDNGYQDNQWWKSDGLAWKEKSGVKHPTFWIHDTSNSVGKGQNHPYKLRLMDRQIEIPWNWPVEVNCFEAEAYCNWKSAQEGKLIKLPSEAEYMTLRSRIKTDIQNWKEAPGNINLEYFDSPCAVNSFQQTDDGFCDIIGNVWQHTRTNISGLDGFQPHKLYTDYSRNTFDENHNIMKGGSWISIGNFASMNTRNGFRKHFFQNAGFRYITPNTG